MHVLVQHSCGCFRADLAAPLGRQSQLPPLAFEARPHSLVEHAVVPIVERGQRRVGVNLRGVAYQRCRVCCRAVVQELGSEAAAAEARVEEADGVVPTVSEANESEAAEAVEREAQLRHDLGTVDPIPRHGADETRQAVALAAQHGCLRAFNITKVLG